ncbi:MAG: hypothetical protein H6707_18745 [Deltaproteobacteria bacterium]|nr:hypothetical protein [Deltaproteobacteria bacterium]
MSRLSLIIAALGLAGCTGRITAGKVRPRAACDLNCPKDQIEIVEVRAGYEYGARGCGRRGTYVFRGGQAILNSPVSPQAK